MIDKQGLLLCARYSVAPNYFGYCGPGENASLVDHLKEGVADPEMRSILKEFETLHLYLKLIARENGIEDAFDRRVVDAYWVGNGLLDRVGNGDYAALLDEKFHIGRKLEHKAYGLLKHKVLTRRLYPHHSFHVFNIFKRTGHDPAFHTLKTMDECRIGWGKVVKTAPDSVTCRTRPLVFTDNRLGFGRAVERTLHREYRGKQILDRVKVGDWVSFHWGHVCDIISPKQVASLKAYTVRAVDYFNS